jgi:hypothetical protein
VVVTSVIEEEEEEEEVVSTSPVPVILAPSLTPSPAPAPVSALAPHLPAADVVASAVEEEEEEEPPGRDADPPVSHPTPAGPLDPLGAVSEEAKPLPVGELVRMAVPAFFLKNQPERPEAAIEDVPRFVVPGGGAAQKDVAISSEQYGSVTFLHPICPERFPFSAPPMLTECRFQLFPDGVQADVGDFCPTKVVMKRVWPVNRLSQVRERTVGGRSLELSLKKLAEQKGLMHERYDPTQGVWEFRANFLSDFPIEAPKS